MLKKLHFSLLALCVFFGLSFSGCKQASNAALQAAVDDFNKTEAPSDLGDGMKITNATIGEKSVIYHVDVDESQVELDYDAISSPENVDEMVKALAEMKSDEDVKTMFTLCRQAELGITYEYKGNKTGKTASVTIPSNRIPE